MTARFFVFSCRCGIEHSAIYEPVQVPATRPCPDCGQRAQRTGAWFPLRTREATED